MKEKIALLFRGGGSATERETRQFVLYVCCGSLGSLTDFSVYLTLLRTGAHYEIAYACGCAAGTGVSFFLNRRFNFQLMDRLVRRMSLFYFAAFLGYAVSAFAMWGMVGGLGFGPVIAKIFSLFLVLAVQYSFNRLVTFGTARA